MLKRLFIAISLVVVITGLLGLLACRQAATTTPAPQAKTLPPTVSPPTASPPVGIAQPALPTISAVVAKVKPSVVAINDLVTTTDMFNMPVQAQGAGSGWILRSDGYIVTNNHVVDQATNVVVTLNDMRTFPAIKIYADAVTDLAIIKIDAQNLPALTTGKSGDLNVGDWVVAIGNALGQGIVATKGIVSGMNISLAESPGQNLHNLVQTDAAINPGNSGGPLVNMAGEVIGITSIKVSQVGVEGMGYAISIDEALPVLNTLITAGFIVRPFFGASVFTVDQSVNDFYGLGISKGVLITDVAAGSPAENAGLKSGDVITAIDGKDQTDDGALNDYVNSLKVGQQIQVSYFRSGTTSSVSVTLTETPKAS